MNHFYAVGNRCTCCGRVWGTAFAYIEDCRLDAAVEFAKERIALAIKGGHTFKHEGVYYLTERKEDRAAIAAVEGGDK